MKIHSFVKVLILTAVLGPALMSQIGCPAKSGPSGPSGGSGGATATFTPVGTATPTATISVLATCNFSNYGGGAAGVTFATVAGTVYSSQVTVTDPYGDELFNPYAFMASSGPASARTAVYDTTGAGGGPGNDLGQSGFVTVSSSASNLNPQTSFTPIYLAPGTYWVAVQSNSAAASLTYSLAGTGMTWTNSSSAGSTLAGYPSTSSNAFQYTVGMGTCASTIFGNAVTTGGSNDAIPTSSSSVTANVAASSFAVTEYAVVHSLGFYLVNGFTGASGGYLEMGLYSDNSGSPGTILAHTNILAPTSSVSNAWYILPIPDTPIPAGTYWIGIAYASNPPGSSWTFYTQAGGNSVTEQYLDGGGASLPSSPTGLTAIPGQSFAAIAIYNH